jgi:hypothetical protein
MGNWTAIENKRASCLWCSFRTTKNPTKTLPPFEECLNAPEMRQNFPKAALAMKAIDSSWLSLQNVFQDR